MRDPAQYDLFSDQRARPFFELASRLPQRPFREIVDLGCGTGELTQSLAQRWPEAHVLGLDNSPQMLAKATAYAQPGRLEFVLEDIEAYSQPADLIFSNASLQWVEDHESLLPRLAALVNPGGALAVQMPYSFEQPSHVLLEKTALSGLWSAKLADWRLMRIPTLSWYVDLLMGLGFRVDAWETVYYQLLQGEDPVLEWVKGTSLQPILSRLDEEQQSAFTDVYAAALRQAYPPSAAGTVFPFKRIFFVATRPL